MIKEFLRVFSRATLSTKGNSTSIDSTLVGSPGISELHALLRGIERTIL
jgi:hypothetical protein